MLPYSEFTYDSAHANYKITDNYHLNYGIRHRYEPSKDLTSRNFVMPKGKDLEDIGEKIVR